MDTFELHSKQPPRSSAGSSCANTPPLPPPPSMSIQTPLPFPGSGSLQPRHGPRFIFPTVSPARQVPRTPSTRMPVPSFQSFLAQNSPRSRDLSASHSSPLHLGHSASSVVSSASSSSPLRDHVLIVNEDGTETSAEVVPNIENTNKKTRKQGRPNKVSISEYLLRFRTFVFKGRGGSCQEVLCENAGDADAANGVERKVAQREVDHRAAQAKADKEEIGY